MTVEKSRRSRWAIRDYNDTSPMDRQELRRELAWMCGCGCPEAACATLLRFLRDMVPLHTNGAKFREEIPDTGWQYLILYLIDDRDLIEHGSSVGGSWLSPKGTAFLEALAREEADEFEALCESSCIHGFSIDTDEGEHSCARAEEEDSL